MTLSNQTTGRPVFIWSALIAIVFTLVMLQWSFDRFRLNSAPFVDDVSWLNEGIAMRDALRDGGISGFLHHIAETRTLAPYSIVAAAGFAVFGIVDWAPYLMNGWLIFCLLAFLEMARRRASLPLHTWFLAGALALAFPISGHSIVSFLGDNASGLFIAIGALAFLQGWPSSESRLESWTGTLAWVFAVYGKATLFPETMLIFLITAVAGCLITLREPSESAARGALLRRWGLRTGVVVLLILPYYVLVARNLIDYLHLQNFGALRDVWAFKGTTWESLLFYVTGFSGETMLGPALYLALALLVIRCVLLWAESSREKLRFAVLLTVILIAYALPTSIVNKTTTVGAPFQFLVVLTAISCLYAILKREPRHAPVFKALVAAAVLLTFRFPLPLDHGDSPAVLARHRTLDGLIGALQREDVKAGELVFLTTTGFIGAHTLHYEFLKRRLPLPHFSEFSLSNETSKFPPLIDASTYVIATDPGNDEVLYTAPSAFIQAETLAMVQQNPAFVEVARFNTWRGKHYYLFGRRERVLNPASAIPPADPPVPGPVFARGCSNHGPDGRRWSQREFEIEFPAPRGLYAELTIRFFLPRPHIDKLGPVTLRADIPREGRQSETYSTDGVFEFRYRYAIKQHLVSTVPVRFHLNKAMPGNTPGDEYGLLLMSAELNPIPRL